MELQISRESIPHFGCWVGAWAMHEASFQALYEQIRRTNFTVHLADMDGNRKAALERCEDDEAVIVDGIGIVSINGPMMKHAASMSNNCSTVLLRREILNLANDPGVKGIMIKLCTPGGTLAGTTELGETIQFARTKKPVWGYGTDMVCSAGYWTASQCERLETNSVCLTGSIGTYSVVTDLSERAAKEGIKVHVISAGANKGAGTPGTPITDEHLAAAQSEITKLNEFFLQAVSSGRSMPIDRVRELATGICWIGADAQAQGLVDGVSKFDDYFARFAEHCNASANKYRRSDNSRMQGGRQASTLATSQTSRSSSTQGRPMSESNTTPVDARAELKAYTSRFGLAHGVDFFERGLSLADASVEYSGKLAESHKLEIETLKKDHESAISKLTAERDAIAKERDEFKAKLTAAKVSLGEADAIDVGKPAQSGGPKTFSSFIRPAHSTK
ncbi:MAG: S49 family peptidase [Pirellula sp.]